MSLKTEYESSMKGHFLIAMPSLVDPNFKETVTFMVEHTPEGAMGLVINHVHGELLMDAVFSELKLKPSPEIACLPLHLGGPVHTGQIFILHGPPFDWEACRTITPSVAFSNSMDVVEMLAQGKGPKSFILTLGCAGWGPGQLETEIMANSWLTCPATESIIFETPAEKRWEAAAGLIGIDPARLADTAGQA